MANLHISISAEPIFNLGPITITNSMLVSLIITFGLSIFAILSSKKIKDTPRPKGVQAFLESIIEALFNFTASIGGERLAKQIFPYIATFFLFILLGNWFGLLPGVGTIGIIEKHETSSHQQTQHQESDEHLATATAHLDNEHAEDEATTAAMAQTDHGGGEKFVPLFRGATADLNITLALALVSVALIQYVGMKNLGLGYFKKFIDFSNPIKFFIGILESVAEFAKILSFAFRLFGNIFAGEVLLAVMAFLVPLAAPIPFIGLEIFVGIVQALVFSMLTLVFMNLATIHHGEDH